MIGLSDDLSTETFVATRDITKGAYGHPVLIKIDGSYVICTYDFSTNLLAMDYSTE